MNEELHRSLARGIDWLIAQQGSDGGWHSKTYGQLKDGASVTALALYALSQVEQRIHQKRDRTIERGFAFLDRGLAKRGTIASPDGSLDFPTYASALWLLARAHLRLKSTTIEQTKPLNYLLAAQVHKRRGFAPDSPSYGGWDFLGLEDATGITTGTNVSITCFVLEALAGERQRVVTAGPAAETLDAALRDGKSYVLRCQQADGGFAFTCEPASLNNKAAYRDRELTQPRSYGTATCDGVRALLACGVKAGEEPLAKALAWLAKRPELEVVPGFEGLPPEAGWDRGLRYYYYASLARGLPHFPLPDRDSRRAALAKHVIGLQQANGFWVNESDRMRENDPLIATPLALVALAGVTSAP
jgi:hypothetical protein